uniref:Transforming growth factor-beta receptor-associated protein 1 n=1 Tax=Anthurium amnicola TaxID=1678845 RepID=A0A1D1Y7D2_9ARAE
MDRRGRPRNRTALEAFAEFEPSKAPPQAAADAGPDIIVLSLSVFTAPEGSRTQIYVGTHGGAVVLLSLLPSSAGTPSRENGASLEVGGGETAGADDSPRASVEFVRSASVGSSPVDEIQVLAEVGRLIVLSGGCLFLLDLLLLQPARKLGFIKGATALSRRLVCTDSASSDPLGDGASKSEFMKPGQKFLQRIGGSKANGVRSRVLEARREGEASCFVAVAVEKKFVLMELILLDGLGRDVTEYGGISVILKEIQSISGVMTMGWLDDSIIVGTVAGYTLFSTATGQATPLFALPEISGPPRLKPLCKSKEALLLVDNVGVVVNSSGQPVGGSLIFRQIPDSITEISPYVLVSGDGWMDLYRKNTGICVQSASFSKSSSGPCIVSSDDWRNEVIVAMSMPFKVICFQLVSAEEQIKDLLRKKYFREAICLVEELESEGEMTKEMLSFVHAQVGFLLLFDLHFEDAVNHFLLSEIMQPSEIFPFIMRDPNRWSMLVPRKRYWGLHPPPVLLESVVDEGLSAIQRAIYLRKAGIETTADEDFLLNPPSKVDLLESAIENIIRYLRVCRDKDLGPFVKEGVDTLLMYLNRTLNRVVDMEQLASSQNSCVVEELEALLEDSGHSRTLAFLYASKGVISKALAIWRKLARNYSTGLWRDSPTTINLCPSQRAAALEASKLLEESSDQDLVLQHLGWVYCR